MYKLPFCCAFLKFAPDLLTVVTYLRGFPIRKQMGTAPSPRGSQRWDRMVLDLGLLADGVHLPKRP